MRLDHLLSKEEKVGVVLLSSCQGVSATERQRKHMPDLSGQVRKQAFGHMSADRARRTEGSESWAEVARTEWQKPRTTKELLVAMRSGETPVRLSLIYIPNTKVKP